MHLDDYDLQLIRERLLAHFTLEELEKEGWLDRPADGNLRRQLGELDVEFFCRFYLRDHFRKPPAPVHKHLFVSVKRLIEATGRAQEVWVLPRGWAKTTIGCLGLPTWCVAYEKRKHILIISDSFDQAKDQLQTLKTEFEDNERLEEDFGKLEGSLWQAAEIVTVNRIKIRALGSGMKIRGLKFGRYRPDLIILDDVENLKAVQSDTSREHLRNWLTRSVMKAGWEDTKLLTLGNYLHWDCLLLHLVENPMFTSYVYSALESWPERLDLWDKWRGIIVNLEDKHKEETARKFYDANKTEMLKGARSAWPEAFSVYDLMVIRVSEGEASFNTELMNSPRDPTKALFHTYGMYRREWRGDHEWLVPLSGRAAVRLCDCAVFGFTDPSLGRTTAADYSAIILLAKAPTRQQFVLEADIKRRPPDQIIHDQMEWARQYAITRWGIESNQFQAMFASDSAWRSMEEDVYLPVTPVHQMRNKQARIQSLQPDFENRYILLPEHGQELLKQQLEQFPDGKDDGPDALEGARTIAREWEPIGAEEIVEGEIHQFGEPQSKLRLRRVERDPWAEADELAEERIRELKEAQGIEVPEKPEIFTPVTIL